MNTYRIASLLLLLLLGGVTLVALLEVGYIGIFQLLVESSAGWPPRSSWSCCFFGTMRSAAESRSGRGFWRH